MGFSYHFVSGINVREAVAGSMTLGGLMGYGLGLFMVINGLSFNSNYLLRLPELNPGLLQDPPPQANHSTDPFIREQIQVKPNQGWTAVYRFRF